MNLSFDLSDSNIVFLPVELDDEGLSVSAYRVFVHIYCHEGNGTSFPPVYRMAKTCRMNRKTVYAALRTLEAQGLIKRQTRRWESTKYIINPPSKWRFPERNVREKSPEK